MRGIIVALVGVTVMIAMASLLAMVTSGSSLAGVQYQASVVDEAILRQRRLAGATQVPAATPPGVAERQSDTSGGAPRLVQAVVPASAVAAPAVHSQQGHFQCAENLDLAFVKSVWSERQELVATFTNGNGIDFARNLYWHATAAGLKHIAVGAMDGGALEGLAASRIPCFPMRDAKKSSSSTIGWGSAAFKNLGVRKITLLIDLLELGVNTILLDADTVLLHNPLPFLRRWPDADVLASTDHLTNSTATHGLERLDVAHSHWNVGFFYLKAATALPFAHAWRELLIRKPHWWDQHAFGWLLRQGVTGDGKGPGEGGPNGPGWHLRGDKSGLSDPHLFRCFSNHSLVCGTLPVVSFANGHVGLVQRLHAKLKVPLYFVHATHQYSATVGKRHRLREEGVWMDPPEYYAPPEGLLYSPLRLPDSVLHPIHPATGEPLFQIQRAFLNTTFNHSEHPALQAHFTLANLQMKHIRDGVAAAWALGRKLVLPPLACAYDRGPFPHVGKAPGALEQVLPIFPCPLDYVFELDRKKDSRAGSAPMLMDVAREYSLLNNTRMPRAVLDGALRLATVPAGAGPAQLRAKWQQTTLVELEQLPPAFGEGSLLTPEQQEEFKRVLPLYPDVWCCINPIKWGLPGHVLYDPMFDVVPHTDRLGRTWTCPWHIVVGNGKPRC